MYLFYIFHMTNVTASNGAASTSDNAGGGTFIGMFMGLTPIVLLLTWWYAMPTTVHDIFVEMYNGIYGSHPMLPGGIAYSSMRCPGDVQTRLVESTSSAGSQTGGGTGNAFRVLGMGLTELGLVSLMGIVLTLVVAYMWSYRLEAVVGSHSKLNADTDSLRKNTVVIRNN